MRAHDAGARRVRSRNDAEASPPVRTRKRFRTQLARRLPGCLGRHRGPRRCHGRSRRASAVVPGRDAPGDSTAVRLLGDSQRGHAGRPVLARCRVHQSVHGERRSPNTSTTSSHEARNTSPAPSAARCTQPPSPPPPRRSAFASRAAAPTARPYLRGWDLRAPIRSAGIRAVHVSSSKVPIGSSAARLRRSYSRRSWSRGLKARAGIFSCRTRDPG